MTSRALLLPERNVDNWVHCFDAHVPAVPLTAVAPQLWHLEEVCQVHQLTDVILVNHDVARVAKGQDGVENLVIFVSGMVTYAILFPFSQ